MSRFVWRFYFVCVSNLDPNLFAISLSPQSQSEEVLLTLRLVNAHITALI
jgi:hypothetical protein